MTEEEQKTFRRLMEKMSAPPKEPDKKANVEERLDRLEKAIEDLRRALQGQQGGGREGGGRGGR